MQSETTNDVPDDSVLGAYVDSAGVFLGLPIEPAWRDQILFHLKTIGAAARLIEAFPLDDTIEPAPVYEA